MEYNNDYNYQENSIIEGAEKRPTGLTVLCILTFIGSGFVILAYFLSFALYDLIQDTMLTMAASMEGTMAETYENAANIFAKTSQTTFLLMTIPYLCSLVGAGIMLNMRKIGFHLYVVGQILVLGLPMLVLKNDFSVGGLILSALFVALYAIFFKKMR